MRPATLTAILICLATLGCGTSTWTDTKRSATEQLLISDAMDRAVTKLDLRALAGKEVYLETEALKTVTDADYLTSTLRQHVLASGCILRDKREDAQYIIEARAGAVGTDRHDLLLGVPEVSIPTVIPVDGYGIPSQIPEIPFIKRTDQKAVAKIAVFAYNRETGRPVWQSGLVPVEADAKARWVLGAGPFQSGSIYDGTKFAGQESVFGLGIPAIDFAADGQAGGNLTVADEAYFVEPPTIAEKGSDKNENAPQTATKPGTPDKAAKKTASTTKPRPAKPEKTAPTTAVAEAAVPVSDATPMLPAPPTATSTTSIPDYLPPALYPSTDTSQAATMASNPYGQLALPPAVPTTTAPADGYSPWPIPDGSYDTGTPRDYDPRRTPPLGSEPGAGNVDGTSSAPLWPPSLPDWLR